MLNINGIFRNLNKPDFEKAAMETFYFQAKNNSVYKQFISHLNINPNSIKSISQIPFLPIQLFKTHKIVSATPPYDLIFHSSGTTSQTKSKHYVKNKNIYEQSFIKTFEYFFGKINKNIILALLPSYLEQENSSLVYMVKKLITLTKSEHSGFYLYNEKDLINKLKKLEQQTKKTILLGVSYALLDFAEKYPLKLKNTIVMETGGMKGRKKEMLREELHKKLEKAFGLQKIYSEYGMTELLTQSYSKGNGIFETPPWKKILIRNIEDPFEYLPENKTGGINIIDLANINSCSFIATQDLGKKIYENKFEIVGRFDNSDIRGCNLLVI